MYKDIVELEKSVIKDIHEFEGLEKTYNEKNTKNHSIISNLDNKINTKLDNSGLNDSFSLKKTNINNLTIFTKDENNLIDSNKTFEKISDIIKELVENSIDANAKNISILIVNGGLDKIEITDDGIGIPVFNFKNLCKRYYTTKANDYDKDIKNLKTLGYRGEALSILSYNSTLKITSRVENSDIGYEVCYKNGGIFLSQWNSRIKSEGNNNNNKNNNDLNDKLMKIEIEKHFKIVNCYKGTSILVEQIFYNNLIRRKSFDIYVESQEIVNLVSKFALHFHNIDFTLCNNSFMNRPINTQPIKTQIRSRMLFDVNNSLSLKNSNNFLNEDSEGYILNIKKALISKYFENEASENLFQFTNKDIESKFNKEEQEIIVDCEMDNAKLSDKTNLIINFEEKNSFFKNFKFNAFFTKPSANLIKNNFIVFVNDRLVNMPTLQNLVVHIYSKFLIKNGKFFGYVNLKCAESAIDYNLKANKSEIYFREEQKFFDFFSFFLEKELSEEIASKNYYVSEYNNFYKNSSNNKIIPFSNTLHTTQINDNFFYAKDKVRVDNKTIDINKYFKNKIVSTLKKNKVINQNENESEQNSSSECQIEVKKENIDIEININNDKTFKQKRKIDILNYDKSSLYLNLKKKTLLNEEKLRISNLISEKFYSEENINNYLTEVVRNSYYIGYDENNSLAFIQNETSLFILNMEFFIFEIILHRIIVKKGFNLVKLNIESKFELVNLIKMVEENYFDEICFQDKIKNYNKSKISIMPILNVDYNLNEKLAILQEILNEFLGIKYNENNSIKEILFVDLFEGNIPYEGFVQNLPFLNYSYLKEIYEKQLNIINNNPENKKLNENIIKENNLEYNNFYLSNLYQFLKIYTFYLCKFYINFFMNSKDRESNDMFLKNFLFNEIKTNGFIVRKNTKREMIMEKIIDTETLYTVFERC